jgi:hypothetical protein
MQLTYMCELPEIFKYPRRQVYMCLELHGHHMVLLQTAALPAEFASLEFSKA